MKSNYLRKAKASINARDLIIEINGSDNTVEIFDSPSVIIKSDNKPLYFENLIDIDFSSMYPPIMFRGPYHPIIDKEKGMSRRYRRILRRIKQRYDIKTPVVSAEFLDGNLWEFKDRELTIYGVGEDGEIETKETYEWRKMNKGAIL